jgi:hypothetical protein
MARDMSYFVRKGTSFVSDMEYHLKHRKSAVSKIQPLENTSGDNMSILMTYIESQKSGGYEVFGGIDGLTTSGLPSG